MTSIPPTTIGTRTRTRTGSGSEIEMMHDRTSASSDGPSTGSLGSHPPESPTSTSTSRTDPRMSETTQVRSETASDPNRRKRVRSDSKSDGRKSKRRSKQEQQPSTIKVLCYVLIVYLAYGLFTRSDEHEHLPEQLVHLASSTSSNLRHGISSLSSSLSDPTHSGPSDAWRYSQEYVHDHAPRLDHALRDGVGVVRGLARGVVGSGDGGEEREEEDGGKDRAKGSTTDRKSGGGKGARGVYTLSLPSNPFGARRRGSTENVFLLLLSRSFTLLILYPLVLTFNLLSYGLHYVSVTLVLLLWTAYYLTLPLTTLIGVLSNSFIVAPASAVWGIIGFFKPVAGLFGGLMGVGAAVGGLVGWVGKNLEGRVWKREEKRRTVEEEREREREAERLQRRRIAIVEEQARLDRLASYPPAPASFRLIDLVDPRRWLNPRSSDRQTYLDPQPQLAAWADGDHVYRARQVSHDQVHPSRSMATPYPVQAEDHPYSAYPYPYPYPYPQTGTGIMKRVHPSPWSGSGPSVVDPSRGLPPSSMFGTSSVAMGTDSTYRDGRRVRGKRSNRISFAAEPTYPPISDADDQDGFMDEQGDGDDGDLDGAREFSEASVSAVAPPPAFHFHFHTEQEDLPATPHRRGSAGAGGGTPKCTDRAIRSNEHANASGSGTSEGTSNTDRRRQRRKEEGTGAIVHSSRFLQSKTARARPRSVEHGQRSSSGESMSSSPTRQSRRQSEASVSDGVDIMMSGTASQGPHDADDLSRKNGELRRRIGRKESERRDEGNVPD